jgi:hypothetical protein
MRFRILCVVGVVGVAGIAVAVAFAASKKPATERSEYDFGNKVVTVQFREAGRVSTVGLKEAKVVRLGDRQFLVGTATGLGDAVANTYDGLKVWMPLADVVQIAEHDDVSKSYQRYELYKRAAAKE